MSEADNDEVRIKGNLFARPDYFTTDVKRGVTRTPQGTRICTLPSEFLLGFRDALIYECGQSYRSVMKACGRRWGKQFIQRFDKEVAVVYQCPIKDLAPSIVNACLADAFNAYGWGRLQVDYSRRDIGVTAVELHDSVMPTLIKESDRPVDELMAGLLAAVFSHLANEELNAVQTECATGGAACGRFLLAATDKVAQVEAWIEDAPADEPMTHEAILEMLGRRTARAPSANGAAETVVVS